MQSSDASGPVIDTQPSSRALAVERGARQVHRAAGGVIALCGLAVLATYAMPWHTVDAGSPAAFVCTGLAHHHGSPVPFVAGPALAAVGAWIARSRASVTLRLAATLLAAVGAPLFVWWTIDTAFLEHLLATVAARTLAERAFDAATLGLPLAALACAIAFGVERAASPRAA